MGCLSVCITAVIIFLFLVYYGDGLIENIKRMVKSRILVVITFSSLTQSQLNRSLYIAKHLPHPYRIAFITDKCNYIEVLKPYKVFCFTVNDFKREFPSYKKMLSNWCNNKHDNFYMWSMCLDSYINSIKLIYSNYKFIWIMEADTAYSGNINLFFKKYDKIYSDLLSLPKRIANHPNEWPWYECYTDEYMKWIKSKTPTERIFAYINIVRVSPNLIRQILINYSLNRHSHCESTLHETAIYNNLSIAYIRKSDFGEKIDVGTRVSQNEWKEYNTNPVKKNKLYHALKFMII